MSARPGATQGADVVQYVRGLEASANQLSTALHWLSTSLIEEARNGQSLGLSLATQLNGPVRALSVALMNLNEGVATLLARAEDDLRHDVPPQTAETRESVH